MSAPLAGVRVIDLTTVVVGPTATLFLADYGADVIKVEAPGGDLLRTLGGPSRSGQLSGKFTHFNRNKRSLVLDLKQKPARDLLERLLATADVFIANIREAALARLGLASEARRARHRRLIVCNLAGFRRDGPYRDRPAYDTIIQGMAGVAACNARVLGEPRFVPMVFADHVVGLIAAQCVLAALYRRERTGEGEAIEVPMFENMTAFVLAEHLGDASFVPPRGENGDRRVLHPLGKPIATKDGFICESLTQDEHLKAIGFFRNVDHPVEGEMIELAHPNRFSSGLREDCRPAPLIGGDSRAIAAELGYSGAEIDALVEQKAVIDGRPS
jgi:crotonobetainyl-CoA:carnitine CoA-transferase CaiB-like acyl-CoA transferase